MLPNKHLSVKSQCESDKSQPSLMAAQTRHLKTCKVILGSGPLPVFLKWFSLQASKALKYAPKSVANDSAIVLQGWNRY